MAKQGFSLETRFQENRQSNGIEQKRKELRRILNAHLKGASVARRALRELEKETAQNG